MFQYHRGGIYLPNLELWLDPHEPQAGPEKVFVSHAHSDHIADHREVILSAPTAHFLRARMGGAREEHVLSFDRRMEFETGDVQWQLTLLPAGHVFGSAMSLIEAEGQSLLYTGDFKLRRGLSAEPCEPRHAETLIMETTYGRPHYQFPPTAEVLKGVIRFCREAIDNDKDSSSGPQAASGSQDHHRNEDRDQEDHYAGSRAGDVRRVRPGCPRSRATRRPRSASA